MAQAGMPWNVVTLLTGIFQVNQVLFYYKAIEFDPSRHI